MNLPVMVNHSSVCFFIEICTAGLPKYHLGSLKKKEEEIRKEILRESKKKIGFFCFIILPCRTGIALFGSSPFINCTLTVMLRAEPWRLAKFRL